MAKGRYQEWLTPDGLTLLEAWARDGLTDEQISHNMGIRRSTLAEWKNKFPDISDALKKSKAVADIQVENSLYKRAVGYEYTEEKIEVETTADGMVINRKVVQTVKQVVPDTTAQIFWLKNRKPDKWRDKQDIEHSGSFNVNNPFSGLSTEELRKLIKDD
jgi:hypothetical protein